MEQMLQLRKSIFFVLFLPASFFATCQRLPVLNQISLPHNYYYHELYLPQLTSGPSSAAWMPDGKSLVFSMAGSLWKQNIGSDAAEQLTDGNGYDYQPDVSPDGKYQWTSRQKMSYPIRPAPRVTTVGLLSTISRTSRTKPN